MKSKSPERWAMLRSLICCLSLSVLLTGCTATDAMLSRLSCPLTEPLWIKPPEDSAVLDPPAFEYYFVNEGRSIWASAGWAGREDYHLRASEEGIKMGWFRPAGIELVITGQRMDAQAPPLHSHAPCCYPTRFQATGLYFPTEGCWEVKAKAGDSELSFVVWVEP